MPGFPIRTPWDHSLVDSSPRPIAASHVLHRLLVPRHPPFALDNLTTKMLASTVQFSTNNQPTTHSPTPETTTWSRFARPGHAWRLTDPSVRLKALKDNHSGCSFRTQQGAYILHQPHHSLVPTTPKSSCTRGTTAVAGAELASVSAI